MGLDRAYLRIRQVLTLHERWDRYLALQFGLVVFGDLNRVLHQRGNHRRREELLVMTDVATRAVHGNAFSMPLIWAGRLTTHLAVLF